MALTALVSLCSLENYVDPVVVAVLISWFSPCPYLHRLIAFCFSSLLQAYIKLSHAMAVFALLAITILLIGIIDFSRQHYEPVLFILQNFVRRRVCYKLSFCV